MGSCNGFICLALNGNNIFIWNPSTGDYKQYPDPRISLNTSDFVFNYGFGYDSTTDDYLIVLAVYNTDTTNLSLSIHVKFISLKTKSCGKIQGSINDFVIMMIMPKAGSFSNGALHWLIFGQNGQSEILAFDLAEKKIREVPLPDGVNDEPFECDVGVLGGCLCVTSWSPALEIWYALQKVVSFLQYLMVQKW
ncbi:F-box family protein [Quillaja saponaria]|uniref:F-box family protein n=1 Tax=Quillaja saponaria TaxID=32244 RepID=A0AAD7Q119_QUISA|nr:F-box family protein [Quillaja saponaria]